MTNAETGPCDRTGHASSRSGWARVRLLLAAALLAYAIPLLAVGFLRLCVVPEHYAAMDLEHWWQWERQIWRGRSPLDEYSELRARSPLPAGDTAVQEQRTPPPGVSLAPSYPPWSFVFSLAFAPPFLPWRIARVTFTLLNLAALFGVAWWAYARGRSFGRGWGEMLAAAWLAFPSHLFCLTNGQYGILVAGLVVASMELDARGRGFLAGVACALALTKPHISGFSALVFAARRRWRVMAGLALTLSLASAACWVLVRRDPLHMLLQACRSGTDFACTTQGAMRVLFALGPSPRDATWPFMAVFFVLGAVLIYRWRHAPPLTLFALASVFGIQWTYHKAYDNDVIIILMVALARAVSRRPSLPAVLSFALLLGAQLAPLRLRSHSDWRLELAEVIVWVVATVVILTEQGERGESAPSPRGRTTRLLRLAPHDRRPA